MEIEEKINKIRWCKRQGNFHLLLTTNGKLILTQNPFEITQQIKPSNFGRFMKRRSKWLLNNSDHGLDLLISPFPRCWWQILSSPPSRRKCFQMHTPITLILFPSILTEKHSSQPTICASTCGTFTSVIKVSVSLQFLGFK